MGKGRKRPNAVRRTRQEVGGRQRRAANETGAFTRAKPPPAELVPLGVTEEVWIRIGKKGREQVKSKLHALGTERGPAAAAAHAFKLAARFRGVGPGGVLGVVLTSNKGWQRTGRAVGSAAAAAAGPVGRAGGARAPSPRVPPALALPTPVTADGAADESGAADGDDTGGDGGSGYGPDGGDEGPGGESPSYEEWGHSGAGQRMVDEFEEEGHLHGCCSDSDS